ncbi:MAG: deoxyribose-phosphate aldolase, partial [Clostridia bacterium]|nr:deoxyribose-phosphate aldolase [Clostridia bacterium]
MDRKTILAAVDHTLLKQTATRGEIRALCEDAARYGTASVCVPPVFVAFAREVLAGRSKVCTVIGFPNGNATSAVKAFETKDAVINGADEIDMVANLSLVREGDWDGVGADIAAVRAACPGKVLKVIVETCLLTEDEKKKLPSVVCAAGADYI